MPINRLIFALSYSYFNCHSFVLILHQPSDNSLLTLTSPQSKHIFYNLDKQQHTTPLPSIMAGPSQYKFNNAEDPNDAGALRKALSGIKIGRPETFGGKFHFGADRSSSGPLARPRYLYTLRSYLYVRSCLCFSLTFARAVRHVEKDQRPLKTTSLTC